MLLSEWFVIIKYEKRKILKTEKEVPRKVQILRKRNKIKRKKSINKLFQYFSGGTMLTQI